MAPQDMGLADERRLPDRTLTPSAVICAGRTIPRATL
jgi:hypothetical protein